MLSNTQLLLSGATKRLTVSAEQGLFRRLVAARNTVNNLENQRRRRTPQESSQLGIARQQLSMVREQLVTANLPCVVHIAQKYVAGGITQEQLVSEGLVGLLRCIDKFDPERGFKFSTYLCRSLINIFCRFIAKQRRHTVGRVDDEEDYIQETESAESYDYDEVVDLVDALDTNRAELTEVEMAVIRFSYGIGVEGGPRTMHEIHMIVGLTKGRVQQIHGDAVDKLRSVLKEAHDETERFDYGRQGASDTEQEAGRGACDANADTPV